MKSVLSTEPSGQKYDPPAQLPLQPGVVAPVPNPYHPGEQGSATTLPVGQYKPGGHADCRYCMGVVEPGAHHQPAAHTPEQSGDVRPGVEPYLPAGHGATTPVPGAQYDPAGHVAALNCVALVDPAAQK